MEATETVYEGASGLMVEVIESYDDQPPAIRYDVFLDGVSAAEFGTDQYEIF